MISNHSIDDLCSFHSLSPQFLMEQCGICLNSFVAVDPKRWHRLDCKHQFCRICVGGVIQKSILVCPLCRKESHRNFQFSIKAREGKQVDCSLPGDATLRDLALFVNGQLENKESSRIDVAASGITLVEPDDCRLHLEGSEDAETCPLHHADLPHKLVHLVPFATSETDKMALVLSNPSVKEKCSFALRLVTKQIDTTLAMFRYRTVSDLYRQVYRVVFGKTGISRKKLDDSNEVSVAIVLKGNLLDPASPTFLSHFVDAGEEATLHLVLGHPESIRKRLKPIYKTCTGGILELAFLEKQGIVKQAIHEEKLKEDDTCAHCLNLLSQKEGRQFDIEPAVLVCGHLIHVECLIPNLRNDLMKQTCFHCRLCEDVLFTNPCALSLKWEKKVCKKQSMPVPDKMKLMVQSAMGGGKVVEMDVKRTDSIQVIYDGVKGKQLNYTAEFILSSLHRQLTHEKHVMDYPGIHLAPVFVYY